MKYIVYELNMVDNSPQLSEVYAPTFSLGETPVLRIVLGNFDINTMEVSFKSDIQSKKELMLKNKIYFDISIKDKYIPNVSKEAITDLSFTLYFKYLDKEYSVNSSLLKVLGIPMSLESKNDLENIYKIINNIRRKL